MKFMRIAAKTAFCVAAALCLLIFASLFYLDSHISDSYRINQGETLQINSFVPVRAAYEGTELSQAAVSKTTGNVFDVKLNMLGFIPAGKVQVEVVDELYVAVLGSPFGIKIYTEGVLVVGFSDVDTENGYVNPAKDAGIKEGDFIVSLNGVPVYTNEDVSSIIQNSLGEKTVAEIVHDGNRKTVAIYAAKSKASGVYRAGIWVKDSSAGIGTLTFYSPATNVVSGLGHGICDTDTGTLLTLNSGEFVTADIVSVKAGRNGNPGELKGRFTGKSIADFHSNLDNGVYGNLTCHIDLDNLVRVALKQEVHDGQAYILTTVEGSEPQYYTCTIKIRNQGDTQNLLVTVTDPRLLNITGGIVQGMSGSPIIQDEKLVGAVTHVLVENSATGYGIFAENMLDTAQRVAGD